MRPLRLLTWISASVCGGVVLWAAVLAYITYRVCRASGGALLVNVLHGRALIQDTHSLLRSQGENTQSAMRLEFTSKDQIKKAVVKTYVKQAIAVEKAGLNVDFKAKRELELPKELTQILNKDSNLAKAFHALTPGRRRGYVLHFTGAKQSKTRTVRIEKCIPKILAGKGMNDR